MHSEMVGAIPGRDRIAPSVALVGCGEWGRHILRDLRELGADVHVVARSAESRGRAAAGGATMVVSTVSELPPVHGAVVATTTVTHAEVVEELLDHAVPIFVEKPLTADVGSARRVARVAGDRLFVMDKWRYHAGVELLRDIAASGELGRPVALRTTRVASGHRFDDVDTVWIHAPHDLAIALEILGELPPARAAVAERVDGDVTGMVGLLGNDPWHAVEISATAHERRREIKLVCEGGTASLADAYADHVVVAAHDGEPALRPIATEFPLLRELRAFLGYLDGGEPPRSSAAEGVAIVERIAELRRLAGVT